MRKQVGKPSVASVVVAVCIIVVLAIAYAAKFSDKIAVDMLVDELYDVYITNGTYAPTKYEIRSWIGDVDHFKTIDTLRDREGNEYDARRWYMFQIFKESTGNPTARGDTGKGKDVSRGLLGIIVPVAKDVCARGGWCPGPNLSIGLYNPTFNLHCGVANFEYMYEKYGNLELACRMYNGGQKGAGRNMYREEELETDYFDWIVYEGWGKDPAE